MRNLLITFVEIKNNKMKQFFTTIILFCVTLTLTAKDSENLFTIAKNKIDTAKTAVVETVKTADTSSNFKMIYSDLKDGVLALGQSLKVGAEHVYIVLVKQQIVKAVVYLFLFIVSIIFGVMCYFQWGKIEYVKTTYDTKVKEDRPLVLTVIFGFISCVSFVVFIFHINIMITGFVNPEYGAIKDVVEFVQKTGDNTCQTCN